MKNTRLRVTLAYLRQQINSEQIFLIVALLVAIFAAWPLVSQPGLLNTRGGGDSPFLLQRLQQLTTALKDGHFPVRWMPDANYGYGYPFYNYYAPLSIYIASLFRLFGFSFVTSIKLAQLSGFVMAAWAMFALARRWLGGIWPALLAAAAYTLAPFHMVNVYVRGDSLAEFWAMALYPLAFLALDKVLAIGRTKSKSFFPAIGRKNRALIALLALAYGALILSHNISALIISPFLLLYLILPGNFPGKGHRSTADRVRRQLGSLLWPVLAFVLGLGLSAWFWLPALAERSLVQLDPVTSGYFHFSNHFQGLGLLENFSLIQPQLLFNYDVAAGNPFRMGLLQAILIATGLVSLFLPQAFRGSNATKGSSQPSTSIPRIFLVIGLLISTLMITPLSNFLWEELPLLAYTQFPWRFLSIQAFFGALIIAAIARLRGRQWITPLVIGIFLASSLMELKPDFLLLSDADVTPEKLAQYEWFTGNIGSTVSAEYLPDTVQPRAFTSEWLKTGIRDQGQFLGNGFSAAKLLEREATYQKWQFSVDSDTARVNVPTIDWPNWRALASNERKKELPVSAAPGSGRLQVELSANDEIVEFRLKDPVVRIAGEWIALLSVVLVIWLWLPDSRSRLRRRYLILPIGLLLLLLVGQTWPERTFSDDNLTWDYSQKAFLQHDEEGVRFDNGAILESYHYSEDEIDGGGQLDISLVWRNADDITVSVALATPAINRDRTAPLLVEDNVRLRDGKTIVKLYLPENSPVGLYVPRILVSDAVPLTASGQPRGDLFLRPVRVRSIQPSAPEGPEDLDARVVGVKQRDSSTVDIQLQWLTRKPITQNYNYSIRLIDSAGQVIAFLDQQPGYGYQPSSGWLPGKWVNDWLALIIPDDLPGRTEGKPYAIVARLYEIGSDENVLLKLLGHLDWVEGNLEFRTLEPRYTLPDGIDPIQANFSNQIALRGYSLNQEVENLSLTLYWQALEPDLTDYSHFVHLKDPLTSDIVTQHDSMPFNNSYPTSQWSANEIVADPLTLELDQIPSGRYEIIVGLYQSSTDGLNRLVVIDDGAPGLDALKLPEEIVLGSP